MSCTQCGAKQSFCETLQLKGRCEKRTTLTYLKVKLMRERSCKLCGKIELDGCCVDYRGCNPKCDKRTRLIKLKLEGNSK